MDSQGEGESYWNRSHSKGFCFDDEEEADTAVGQRFYQPRPIIDDNVSETSFDNSSNIINVNINTVISDDDLKLILDEQSLEGHTVPKGIGVEDELRMLRRRLQYMMNAPSVLFTAQQLLLGKKCSLEAFKSLSDKEELLDEVIRVGNGDAILAVVIFMARTLNRKHLHRILLHKPLAGVQYVDYLIQTRNTEAIDLLTMLGHYQECAVLQMKTILHKPDSLSKRQKMKQLLSDYMNQPGVVPIYYQILNNAISLSELLSTAKDVQKGVDYSPIEVLYEACSKHKWTDTSTTEPWSPHKLINEHQISPSQFEWTALNERTKSQAFLDLEGIFEKSSWHSKQKQFQISFPLELAILRLHALNAPQAVIYSFLSKVGNASKKLNLSKQVQCNRGIVDALVGLKDLSQLERLKESLAESSEERFYCEKAMKTVSTRRW